MAGALQISLCVGREGGGQAVALDDLLQLVQISGTVIYTPWNKVRPMCLVTNLYQQSDYPYTDTGTLHMYMLSCLM